MPVAATFFDSQMKKTCQKQELHSFIQQRNTKKKHKEQCIKNKRLSDYIYSIANLQRKVCLMSTKAGQFIKSCKSM